METRTYLSALRRYLPVATLLLAAGILGSYLYVHVSMPKTAQATVAVLDPLSARPGSYLAAQVTFDAVITSHRLAEVVGERLGEPADAIQAKLSASVEAPAAGFNLSPLYAVQGKGPDTASAIRLVNVAVDEGRTLYLELNRSNPDEIARALARERAQAKTAYTDATAALDAFAKSEDATDLPSEIASLTQTVATLQASLAQAKADLASAQATGTGVTVLVERRVQSYESQIATATTELDRLRGLEPRYEQLSANVDVARTSLSQLSDAQNSLELGQLVPLPSQVKILDSARPRSNFFMQFLIYTLGIMLGLLAAASAIYLLALYRRPPPSAEEIADEFSAPVMAWIPQDAGRRS